MAYIKNTWVDQEVERPRTYQKEDHADGSFTLIDDFGLVSELGTPVNADNMNHIEEGIGEHEERITALENLPDVYLKTNQITNCITEIPQRVKLDLTDGVLTLKAGSQVIVPYGTSAPTMEVGDTLNGGRIVDISWDEVDSKLFYIVQYDTNLTHTQTSSASSGSLSIIVSSNGVLDSRWSNTNINYDIKTNIVNDNYTSLPFALCTQKSGVTISIDQIFNGIGYIGSTIWVDKGVKGLIPNGRNEDGTLNNIEINSTKVNIITKTGTYKGVIAIGQSGTPDLYSSLYYDEKTNYNKIDNGAIHFRLYAGTAEITNGAISNFNPKQPFRAVDYSELKRIVPTGFIGYYPASSPPTGYLVCNGGAISRRRYSELFSVIGTTFGTGDGSTTFNLPLLTDNRFIEGHTTIGTAKSAGLPNITGSFTDTATSSGGIKSTPTGAFRNTKDGTVQNYGGGSGNLKDIKYDFNASFSNSIYGNSTTVQPKALTLLPCIKY